MYAKGFSTMRLSFHWALFQHINYYIVILESVYRPMICKNAKI